MRKPVHTHSTHGVNFTFSPGVLLQCGMEYQEPETPLFCYHLALNTQYDIAITWSTFAFSRIYQQYMLMCVWTKIELVTNVPVSPAYAYMLTYFGRRFSGTFTANCRLHRIHGDKSTSKYIKRQVFSKWSHSPNPASLTHQKKSLTIWKDVSTNITIPVIVIIIIHYKYIGSIFLPEWINYHFNNFSLLLFFYSNYYSRILSKYNTLRSLKLSLSSQKFESFLFAYMPLTLYVNSRSFYCISSVATLDVFNNLM